MPLGGIQKAHSDFSTCRVDGIPARQAGKPNLRHCRGRFLFPAICLQTLYSFPSCGILRKKNPHAEVRPARGCPGPAGKSGATPARSRRCMRLGLPFRGVPRSSSSMPLSPFGGPRRRRGLARARKPAFVCFPVPPRGNGRDRGRRDLLCGTVFSAPFWGPGSLVRAGKLPAAWWAESGVRRSLLPQGGRAAGFFAGSAGLGNGFLLKKRKEVS